MHLSQASDVIRYVWTHPANEGARLKALFRAISFQVRGRVFRRATKARIGTSTFLWAELHRHAASKVVYANPPDFPEMLAWRRLLRGGDLFVDVGANVGSYSLWALDLGATVLAAEPDPASASRFRQNLALNNMAAELHEVAVADSRGEALLTTGLDSTNHLIVGAGNSSSSQMVKTVTLDELLGGRHARGLKIDVEGAEELVLMGARTALRDRRIDVIQLEWNSTSQETLGRSREPVHLLLQEAGYEFYRPNVNGHLLPSEPASSDADLFAMLSASILE